MGCMFSFKGLPICKTVLRSCDEKVARDDFRFCLMYKYSVDTSIT